MKFKTRLEKAGACAEAIEWVGNRTEAEALATCEHDALSEPLSD